MNIYLLSLKKPFGCDIYSGLVIAAETELQARQMANKNHADEGPIWDDVDEVSCEKIGVADNLAVETIFLSSFHAG